MAQLHCADGGCSIPLTARELEVLRLAAELRTNREIAAMLSISHKTVEHHLANIFDKLGVDSRREAVQLARQRGMLG